MNRSDQVRDGKARSVGPLAMHVDRHFTGSRDFARKIYRDARIATGPFARYPIAQHDDVGQWPEWGQILPFERDGEGGARGWQLTNVRSAGRLLSLRIAGPQPALFRAYGLLEILPPLLTETMADIGRPCENAYSITSSARTPNWGGISMPSAVAVLTLIDKTNRVG